MVTSDLYLYAGWIGLVAAFLIVRIIVQGITAGIARAPAVVTVAATVAAVIVIDPALTGNVHFGDQAVLALREDAVAVIATRRDSATLLSRDIDQPAHSLRAVRG